MGEEHEEGSLPRNPVMRPGSASVVPSAVNMALKIPGVPLEHPVRSFMEAGLKRDLGGVRIHTDPKAVQSARAIQARAYTVGADVFFDEGQYYPWSLQGRFVLAHELIHTLQQGRGRKSGPLRLGDAESREERAADRQARYLTLGIPSGDGPDKDIVADMGTIQRFPWLVAGAVAALAAGGVYAWWARKCLAPVEIPMYIATFGNDYRTRRSGGFRLWYYNQTKTPVPSNAWDAFGHCYVACAATKRCGSTTTAIAGRSRELYREYIDSAPHDSYAQDVNNQALGREFGRNGEDCESSCRTTSLMGGRMDLSAPEVSHWDPARGEY